MHIRSFKSIQMEVLVWTSPLGKWAKSSCDKLFVSQHNIIYKLDPSIINTVLLYLYDLDLVSPIGFLI